MTTGELGKAGNDGSGAKLLRQETQQSLSSAASTGAKPRRTAAIIFDYGCVLSEAPRAEDFEPIRKAIGADAAAFQELYWRNREAYDFDTINVSTYFQEIGKEVGVTFFPEQVQRLAILDAQLWATPNAAMVEWARELRDHGFKTAVLSNMSRNVGDYLRREAKWLELFHLLWFSGEHKIGKPDPAFYRSCLESLGVSAEQSLLIDDREVNIKAGEALGLPGIVFRSARELVPQLAPYGLEESLEKVLAHVG
jgi:putative hydrolase of the HAD superfamily